MMLVANNINKKINHLQILENISLEINPGEFKSIIGPNGAGKSTLLKILTGESSYQGDIQFHDKPLSAYKAKEISLLRAVLPQYTSVNFPFTVHQMISLGRTVYNEKKKTSDSIVDHILTKIGFKHFSDRNYLTLSGGEKQKVQLARVLAQIWGNDDIPKLIMLDEPTSNLDIAQQHQLMGLVKEICHQNIAVLAIIHDLNLAAQYSDNLVFLKNGSIVDQGPMSSVFTKTNIEATFCHNVKVFQTKVDGPPFVLPLTNHSNLTQSKAINHYEAFIC